MPTLQRNVKENTEDLSGFKSLARRLKAEYHSDKNTTKWEEAYKVFRHISKVYDGLMKAAEGDSA